MGNPFTIEEKTRIRELARAGKSYVEIAREVGRPRGSVHGVLKALDATPHARPGPRACVICDRIFTPRSPSATTCSAACKAERRRQAKRERGKHRREARRAAAPPPSDEKCPLSAREAGRVAPKVIAHRPRPKMSWGTGRTAMETPVALGRVRKAMLVLGRIAPVFLARVVDPYAAEDEWRFGDRTLTEEALIAEADRIAARLARAS